MFERYNEKARRVIFFARYECSQAGSKYIRPEHLLFGIMREDKPLTRGLKIDREAVWTRFSPKGPIQKVSTSVDIPLDDASKRILAYAAEECDRAGLTSIGPEHLLLGIMREENSEAAKLLMGMGVPATDELRKRISEMAAAEPGNRPGQPDMPLAREAFALLNLPVRLIDEETGIEHSSRVSRVMPRIGDSVSIETEQDATTFRVTDVQWSFRADGVTNQLTMKSLDVRIRRDA